MHYTKYDRSAVWNILTHSDHSNENIDRGRTHLNYDLKDRGNITAYGYYKAEIEQIAEETKLRTGKGLRKDAITLCSWVVTFPKDLPEDKQDSFFKACYEWFSDRYGEDNIVTAVVHMDEVTPHMHLQFMPIVTKDGVRKLCAKELETRQTLRIAHQQLQTYLERSLDCRVNILNEATRDGNKSIAELKRKTASERMKESREREERASEVIAKAKDELEGLRDGVDKLRGEKGALEDKVCRLKQDLEKLEGMQKKIKQDLERLESMQLGIDEIYTLHPEEKKGLFGKTNLKGVTLKDIERLQATAANGNMARQELVKVKAENAELRKKVKPALEERIQRAEEKKRLMELEEMIRRLPEDVRRRYIEDKEQEKSRGGR